MLAQCFSSNVCLFNWRADEDKTGRTACSCAVTLICDSVRTCPCETERPTHLTFAIFSLLLHFAMQASPPLDQVFQYIDEHQDDYVQHLKEWIGIQSESSNPTKRDDVIRMMQVVGETIKRLGGTVELTDVGNEELPSGKIIPLPPVVLGKLGKDPNKTTVGIYGHVDVQPARFEDGWSTDPYLLTEKDGNLYGRGSSDDKGPVLAWLHAIEAFQALKQELPVNLKFIFEGMEESGSKGLDELLKAKNETFFSNIDYIVISDSAWLSKKPALTYGTRGLCYFIIEVQCANQDLHSGLYGGTVHEAMTDLIALLDSLVNSTGYILIPGIDSDVVPLTNEERVLYEAIEFNLEAFKHTIGTTELLHKTKEDVLLHRWRFPSLSIHGIEGAFSGPGAKTVIPAKVTGKFSIRLVPNMDPDKLSNQVMTYLNGVFAARGSPNQMQVALESGSKAWVAHVTDKQYDAGRRAISKVFGVEAELIREGGTIPVARSLQHTTQKSVMMLPIGSPDDRIHSQDEKLSRDNYINGTKLFAAYIAEISQH
ncbi:cytosolic non-specific dipeptidase-like isoform X2 [Scyliorhinus torazame]|uniref:cytosolic non-specific dipeptidase-like isoform X2 n=1 Tax=Scyliorhinus torazame TaxID=75743 RepID=UPI003B5A33F0